MSLLFSDFYFCRCDVVYIFARGVGAGEKLCLGCELVVWSKEMVVERCVER